METQDDTPVVLIAYVLPIYHFHYAGNILPATCACRGLCRYLCVAGVVENWCILCDLKGTSILSFPLPLLLKLVQLIQGSYRGRLYRFYILYAPRLFHFIAKPLVSSLPATTAKKLRVFTSPDDWHHERRAQFAGHQLEKKYGGTAPDIIEVLTIIRSNYLAAFLLSIVEFV